MWTQNVKNNNNGLVSFPAIYEECKQWFDILGYWKEKLHWQVKATGVGHYGEFKKACISGTVKTKHSYKMIRLMQDR